MAAQLAVSQDGLSSISKVKSIHGGKAKCFSLT
jgi:hypothetical protein